jgi:hypothetical protein
MMRSRVAGLALAFAGVAFLTACSGVNYQRIYIRPSEYYRTSYSYAAAGRDVRVIAEGNPFEIPDEAFADAVAASMQGHNEVHRTNFTTTPGETARERYRVVMAFDPPVGTGIHAPCRGPVPSSGQASERIIVQAAFCEGNGALTAARGNAPRMSSPDSPEFQALMAGVTRRLFPFDPIELRELRDDDCPPFMMFCP